MLKSRVFNNANTSVVLVKDGSGVMVKYKTLRSEGEFKLNDTQVLLLESFLEHLPDTVHLRSLPNGVRLVFEYEGGESALDLLQDGTSVVHEYWGSPMWDRWTVQPDGSVEYTGDLSGKRLAPGFLAVVRLG